MKNVKFISLKSIGLLLLLTTAIWSCKDDSNDGKLNPEQAKTQSDNSAKDNAEIIAATQDALEISSGSFEDEGFLNARTATNGRIEGGGVFHGEKHACKPGITGTYSVDQTHKDTLIYSGSMIIDYGDGSTCDSTHVRKGKLSNDFKLIVSFHDSLVVTSTQKITFTAFERDSVILDGVYTTTRAGKQVTIEAKNAKITYPDGTSTSWNGTLTYVYSHGPSCRWKDNNITVTGSVVGTNREGQAFTATITSPIVYKYGCGDHKFRPIAGTLAITLGSNIASTVNYGDGTCDNVYSITVSGTVTEYEFKDHHK